MHAKRFFSAILFAVASLSSALCAKNIDASLEESLELRRITEYWKEKDYNTVKVQIRNFLSKNPKSAFVDQLNAMLGDLYFQEKNFREAAAAYDKIEGQEFRQKCQFHRLHSLYEIGKYDELILSSDLFLKSPNAKSTEINTIRFELAEAYFCRAHAPENDKKKKELFKLALSEYQQLMQTKYSDLTLLPQAQIYAQLEDHSKAASLYTLLAHKDSNKKAEHLFQAACLQLHFDRKAAIDTFGKICEVGGKNASRAAFNQLNLLFQEKRYRDFILIHEKTSKHVPQEKLPLMQYYLGKSLFQTNDFARAIDPLSQSLSSKTLDRSQEKNALLTLIACSKETKNLPLFEKALAHLKSAFANDEETASILLMHAQLCRDKNEWAKARSDIKELLEISPRHPQREALLHDISLLLTQEAKWQEGASSFEAFLQEFPQSTHRINVLRHIVNCRLEDVKSASLETEHVKKELLLGALNAALKESKHFSPDEKRKMRYLLSKTEFELAKYDEAIGNLSEYVRDFHKDPTCCDAYLLLAYSYQKGSRDEIHFALNAEKALSQNPHLQGAVNLHLTLFNTYLGLAGKASSDEKAEMIAKAAGHLFLALDKPVNKENQRWLAGYYFQQYQNGDKEAIERAALVLEKLLGIKETSSILSITDQSLDMEAEAVKLADIYGKSGRLLERAKLLEALTKVQQAHADWHWKYQRMAHFELGKTYLSLGERDKALKTFETLITSSSHASSYFAIAAQIERAKLGFSLLSEADRHENSTAAQAFCDTLKEIQIQRKLHSEPLHLEAALCYVEIKSELAPFDVRKNRERFLLEQMKENFSAPEDPIVQQYLSAAAQFPEKENLFRQYLTFVDLEIQRLEAEENHDMPLLRENKTLMSKLLSESTHETLSKRIAKSMEALGEVL